MKENGPLLIDDCNVWHWTVASAISEVPPDGDKEKQLLQGMLNQRDGLEREMR